MFQRRMTSPIRVHLGACAVVAMLCGIGAVHGRTIQLNWTSDGVRDYTSTPLRVALGDMLELTCRNVSNLFIQTDRIQYDSCNASAGSGPIEYNGFCLSDGLLRLTLTENSQNLENTVNFENNRAYFLTSYSEGSLRGNDHTFTSGGQCEDGLKMIFVIGQASIPPPGGDNTGSDPPGTAEPPSVNSEGLNRQSGSTGPGMTLYIIIGAVVGGVVLVAGLIIMVVITVVCVKKGRCSSEIKTKNSTTYYGNSSTPGYYNENSYRSEPDSQACTLTRADFNLGSKPVIEIKIQETPERLNHDDIDVSVQTFGLKKSNGHSADCLLENQHYKSAERAFDDATGQSSTPSHANIFPQPAISSAKSTPEIFPAASGHPVVKPKPLPRPKRPRQNDVYKSQSADNLFS